MRRGWECDGDEAEDMSRLSFRPRPLDIHKKLPIVKSIKEFEDDEAAATNSSAGASTRNSQLLCHSAEADNEVMPVFVCFISVLLAF